MSGSDHDATGNDLPFVPISEVGLADRSDEIEELSEQDIRLRLYQAMVEIADNEPGIVHRLCRAIASVMYDFCVFYLPRSPGQPVELIAAHDVNPTIGARIADMLQASGMINDSMIEEAVGGGRGTFASELELRLTFFPDEDQTESAAVHSLIVVPLKSPRGTVFGALAVGRHATRTPYDEVDQALLEWIGSHVAMKLENARLYRALRRANRELSDKNTALAEALEVRDKFLATAAHELKTPLTTLGMQVDLLDRTAGEDAAVHVATTRRQVDRLRKLVDQLLDVSQLVEGRVRVHLEEVDLLGVAADVVERFEHSAEQAGSPLRIEGESVRGMWDVSMLDQILTNLVSNAIKYGDGKPIDIRIESTEDDAVICVCDAGHGIGEDDRERVFERFERASAANTAGVGLGLWIVKRIVDRFAGSIGVDSEPGDGTTFRVVLPRRPPPAK